MTKSWFGKVSLVVCLAVVAGCASHYISASKLDVVELGMNKTQVCNNLGQGVRRGAIINKFGQNIEVWEYKVKEGISGGQLGAQIGVSILTLGMTAPLIGQGGEIHEYWLFFVDGHLVRWGRAGDWDNAQKQIYDINFNFNQNLGDAS